MEIEKISKIEILDNEGMYVVLASGGKPMYQYVYREAAEVYWDNDIKGFKSPPPRKWSHLDWYHHIINVVASGLGIVLELSINTNWVNVVPETKAKYVARKTLYQANQPDILFANALKMTGYLQRYKFLRKSYAGMRNCNAKRSY